MQRLGGRVAIVTGAAQGMGATHAKALVEEGARTILTDLNAELGRRLAEELGPNAMFIEHDVRRDDGWRAVLEQGEAAFGPVTVLVNNAGVIGPLAEHARNPRSSPAWST